MSGEFRGGDVNAVLRLVAQLVDDGDAQLSLLTVALVTACRSCSVSKEHALAVIAGVFDDDETLVSLHSAAAMGS
jgi:hypothetical protein